MPLRLNLLSICLGFTCYFRAPSPASRGAAPPSTSLLSPGRITQKGLMSCVQQPRLRIHGGRKGGILSEQFRQGDVILLRDIYTLKVPQAVWQTTPPQNAWEPELSQLTSEPTSESIKVMEPK